MIRLFFAILVLCFIDAGFTQSNIQSQLKLSFDKESRYAILKDSLASIQKNAPKSESQAAELNKTTQKLQNEQSKLYREILELKSVIYNGEQAEPVWAEGFGEIIMDAKKPYEQNKRLVLMYARRDAMEKGGKIIIETMMRMERFEIISESISGTENKYVEEFRSIIQSKGKVTIIDQDNSGNYGKILTVKDDDLTKLQVTVRLKMTSVNNFNPFEKELETIKKMDGE